MSETVLSSVNSIDFQTLAEDAPVTLWLTNTEGENIFTNNKYKNFIGRERVKKWVVKRGLMHYTQMIEIIA